MKKYRTAMGRYRYLIENYPDLGQYKEALEYMSKCQERLNQQNDNS
jgi:outer membrane protein assembly factor BamD (BamD/ComL family)